MAMEGKRWSDRPEVWSSQFKENIWAIIICPRGLAEQLRLIGKVVILDLGFSWCPSLPLFHNDQLRLISLTFIMRSWPGTALIFNAILLIFLTNLKFLLLIHFFGGVALPPRFLQWSVNFLKSQQMVRERQTRISTENNDISREVKCNKFWFVIALSCLRGGLMLTIINMTRIANTVQQLVRSGSRDKTRMCLRQLCSALKTLKSKFHWLTD